MCDTISSITFWIELRQNRFNLRQFFGWRIITCVFIGCFNLLFVISQSHFKLALLHTCNTKNTTLCCTMGNDQDVINMHKKYFDSSWIVTFVFLGYVDWCSAPYRKRTRVGLASREWWQFWMFSRPSKREWAWQGMAPSCKKLHHHPWPCQHSDGQAAF